MSQRGLSGLSYARARQIILAAGLLVLLVVAAVMFVRRVDPIEVAATLLFIPIFIAFVFRGVTGGIAVAVVAGLAYAALRYPAIQLVGTGRFASLLLSRAVAFLAFGALGGFASQQLESSLSKLDQFDEIDDATGLFNARFFVNNTALEMERSDRYRTLFSVTVIDVPAGAFDGMNRRQKDKALRELGQALKDSIRTVDRGVHAEDGDVHRFAAILPETGRDGSRVFVTRLAAKMTDLLAHKGSKAPVSTDVAVFPGDEADLNELRARFTAIDALQHPETAEVTS
ncbi:MAG: GGDEF domain-containing protein [Actinomycetota bacterium]